MGNPLQLDKIGLGNVISRAGSGYGLLSMAAGTGSAGGTPPALHHYKSQNVASAHPPRLCLPLIYSTQFMADRRYLYIAPTYCASRYREQVNPA